MSRSQSYVTRTVVDDAANRHPRDFYPTPRAATLGLLAVEKFRGTIWEPACGNGAMSRALEERGHRVISTDLYDEGFGTPGVDFLTTRRRVSNVVTNPPFRLAEEFIHHALRRATRKAAMIFRLAWLEGIGRYEEIYSKCPPARVLPFTRRVFMVRGGGADVKGGMQAFMWMVWDADHVGETVVRWIPPNVGDA